MQGHGVQKPTRSLKIIEGRNRELTSVSGQNVSDTSRPSDDDAIENNKNILQELKFQSIVKFT